jgi:uncharacterized membrane protein
VDALFESIRWTQRKLAKWPYVGRTWLLEHLFVATVVEDVSGGPLSPPARNRIATVDLLRGAVMIIMALDHTREFFSIYHFQPEDLSKSFGALFFTRWITHFCAPGFFFLAGSGAYFSGRRRRRSDLAHFLWTRGVWLTVLEFAVIDYAFTFDFRYHVGIVIWTLGVSMIVLAALIYLPNVWITSFGGVLILFHNAFDSLRASPGTPAGWLLGFLHQPTFVARPNGGAWGLLYPLIPWVGVMSLGYVFGVVYKLDLAPRRRIILILGAFMSAAFVIVRLTNWYGDPQPWRQQSSVVMSICSFLNCTKYPPSLCFLLMTLGPCLLFLALFDGRDQRWMVPVIVYGRVPLFYFVAHLYVLHLAAIAIGYLHGQPIEWLWRGAMLAGPPATYGHRLPFVYAVWIAVVVALYPACVSYARLKQRSNNRFLSYL